MFWNMQRGTHWVLSTAVGWLAIAGTLFAGSGRIEQDTTWSGQQTIDGPATVAKGVLTISPGAKITFRPGGEINVSPGAALIAKGSSTRWRTAMTSARSSRPCACSCMTRTWQS